MSKVHLALALSVAGMTLLGGCGKEESSSSSSGSHATTPTAQQVADQVGKTVGSANEQTKTVSTALVSEAQKLTDEATTYIKENKLDLADKAIKRLEEMKPQLPTEYGPRIDQLRSAFNTAKSSGGIKLPGTK